MKDDMKNKTDRAIGRVKEAVGKIINNEELEFRGKAQSFKADTKNKVGDLKETTLGKANDFIDKIRDNNDSNGK